LERAESTARLVSVNDSIVLDAEIQDAERWRPVIIVVGEEERFSELCGEDAFDDDEEAQRYLTWSEESPTSIRECMRWARENARTVREVISQEMWETINTGWRWLNSTAAQKLYANNRQAFYQKIRAMVWQVHGVSAATMLHDQAFDFMRIGQQLERLSQTARVIDVKHHMLSTASDSQLNDSPRESAQWGALLRFCSATEPFYKRSVGAATGPRVAEFLLKDTAFPRSLHHCLERCCVYLERIEHTIDAPHPPKALELLGPVAKQLKDVSIRELFEAGLHGELTRIIDKTNEAAGLIQSQYFDPNAADVIGVRDTEVRASQRQVQGASQGMS
jgi:uncharacterized alpha-E superfamily protein